MSDQAPPIAGPLPDVTTERLDLRRFDEADGDELAEVFAHPEVWQYPYGRGFTHGETQEFLLNQITEWKAFGFGCWVARTIDDGRIIGYVGLSVPTFLPEILPAVEVGWRLTPSVWGNGFATEGATAALDQAFLTLGLDRVCSVPQSDNPRSCRVASRLGMTRIRDVVVAPNEHRGAVTALLFEVEREQWLHMRGRDAPVGGDQ